MDSRISPRFAQAAWLVIIVQATLATFLSGCKRISQVPNEFTAPTAVAVLADANGMTSTRLPVRAASSADTLFTKLAPEQSGLDFAHNWVPPSDYQMAIYQSLPGGGVCIGDYDGDDLPDVYLTQPHVGCRLYRNLGDMRFEDVTDTAGLGSNPDGMGCTFVDIEGDGDLDLYVCNFDAPNRLYVNQGDGTFREQARKAGLAFRGASVMMAFADYDQDGDLDAYLATNRLDPTGSTDGLAKIVNGKPYVPKENREFVEVITPADGKPRVVKAGQYDHLYQNNGDGTFTDVTEQAGIEGNYWGLNAIWWDYNRDAKVDLYVSNDFYGPDQFYRNNGDGTFTDVAADVLPHTPWYSMGTDVADINNDGWLDLMGSDMSGTSHYKQKVSMGDMNTNGWFLTHPIPRQYMRNALYLNTGANRFMEIAYLAGVANTDWTWSLKFADLDEDGLVDLYVTNGMNRDWVNTDLRMLSNSQATPEARMKVWLQSEQRNDPNLAFKNDGDLGLTPMRGRWGLEEKIVSYGAAFADLDRDGDLDIVVNNSQSAPGLYRNESVNSHRVSLRLTAPGNTWGVGSTVTIETPDGTVQTRQVTLSQGYMSSNESLVHFGLGDNATIKNLTVVWPDGKQQVCANLPADQFYKISQSKSASPRQQVSSTALFTPSKLLGAVSHKETPYDDYTRQPLLPMQHSQLGPGMAWADVDGDGDDDCYFGGASGQPGQLQINNRGSFSISNGPWQQDALAEDMGALFFDADADGDPDLYVVSGGVECDPNDAQLADRLYLNDGKGGFTKANDRLPNNLDSGSCVTACDFDRDGDLDLFVGGRIIPGQYPLAPNSCLLKNNGGFFSDATEQVAPNLRTTGLVTAAIWSDADADGWIDLLVAHEWGPIKFFHNTNGKLVDETANAGLHLRLGWYNSIAARDLDGDLDIDYVVGNVGLNTKYHATDKHPVQLYCGDFDDSGNLRLIEAEFEGETLFPGRGKSCSTNAMPFLADKFTKFHDFAVADLATIYTDDKLACAHHFSANSLESGVLLNDGKGQFEFKPLPRLAQAAPAFGILITELNGDRYPDLCIAQNFFGPQPETGRMDGGVGLVLLGKGDGTFIPLPTVQSGIVVPGDARSLTMADTNNDGSPEIFFAVNDGRIQSFQQTSNPQTLTIQLTGKNAAARISVRHTDGSTQNAEAALGGGYLSQSPAVFQFGDRGTIGSITVTWPDGSMSRLDDEAVLKQDLVRVIQ